MLNYEIFVWRNGELGAQALVETLERYEGPRPAGAWLEERWNAFMKSYSPVLERMAA